MSTSAKDPLDVRAYASRDWAALAALKEEHWLTQRRESSVGERMRAVDELRRWAHAAQPDPAVWDAARQADLENHVRVAALFRLADARMFR